MSLPTCCPRSPAFQGPLPQPPADRRFYRDVAVQAFRDPPGQTPGRSSAPAVRITTIPSRTPPTATRARFGSAMAKGSTKGQPRIGPSGCNSISVEKQTVKRLTIIPRPGLRSPRCPTPGLGRWDFVQDGQDVGVGQGTSPSTSTLPETPSASCACHHGDLVTAGGELCSQEFALANGQRPLPRPTSSISRPNSAAMARWIGKCRPASG